MSKSSDPLADIFAGLLGLMLIGIIYGVQHCHEFNLNPHDNRDEFLVMDGKY